MSAPVHVSSLVVQCRPERLESVKEAIRDFAGTEIAAEDPAGKLVVVLETDGTAGITDTTHAIGELPGVLSANLAFHAIDETEAPPEAGQGEIR